MTPAILLTGAGKRYDIVSAFGEHAFTIAADPSPLAPARYAADLHVVPPRIDDPGYIPFLEEVVAAHDVGAVVPLTDLDIELLAERVDNGDTDAMQTACRMVDLVIEFAAGMQRGHDHFER